jgi:hypothetical protein
MSDNTVELSKEEFETLKAAYDLQNALYSKNRKGYEKLTKEVFPEHVRTTEEELNPYFEPLKEKVEEISKWKENISASAKEMAEREKFAELKKNYGLTDDGEKEVRKMMKDRGIGDPEAAVALWEKQNPAKSAAEEAYSTNPFAVVEGEDDFAKKLSANPDRAAREMAMKTLRELRSNS